MAPGEKDVWFLPVEEYQVEFFAKDRTWKRASQNSDCYAVVNATSCVQSLEELKQPPFDLKETSMVIARVYAETEDTRTYRDPDDGCEGERLIYYMKSNAIYEGETTNCSPKEGIQSEVTTAKGSVFRGTIEDRGQTMTGTFTLKDGTIVEGTFTSFEYDGKYKFTYPDGSVC